MTLKLQPGKVWAECLCAKIHPDDRPCIVCEVWMAHKQQPPPEVKALFGKVPKERENEWREEGALGFDQLLKR